MTTRTPDGPTTRRDHRTEVQPFTALDGRPLTLVHVQGKHPPAKGPVLVVHGAGVRAELFRPPLPRTFVDALIDAGWDVWLLNWRASIDLDPVPWTLDQAAAYDHPAAVAHVLAATGTDRLKAVVHCQGSTSFMMALTAGLLPQVETVVSNAVSLHPVVPRLSTFKLARLAPLVSRLMPAISPAWGDRPAGPVSRAMVWFVRATHPECRNSVCRMVSFTYGSGRPALWSHARLDEETHDWIRGEFAEVPMSFFAQMNRCVRAGQLVATEGIEGLPRAFAERAPRTDARIALFAGEDNHCFLAESQQRTYDFLNAHRPGRDSLHLLPGYGHLDVFLGRHAATDTYPLILEELAR
ncbi:esterase [Streptomyces showdoensis]|uniref:Esterase n=1 Tax=Streptomyces showdoensis TaxID=68268 RepID=A0A2P2GJX7_STREW|nr:esterase [Streptomyces showdoensis]KKZ71797.1 esterase [Streptomyces showdoensis]